MHATFVPRPLPHAACTPRCATPPLPWCAPVPRVTVSTAHACPVSWSHAGHGHAAISVVYTCPGYAVPHVCHACTPVPYVGHAASHTCPGHAADPMSRTCPTSAVAASQPPYPIRGPRSPRPTRGLDMLRPTTCHGRTVVSMSRSRAGPCPTHAMAVLQSPHPTRVPAMPRPTGATAASQSLCPIYGPGCLCPTCPSHAMPHKCRGRTVASKPHTWAMVLWSSPPRCVSHASLLPAVGSPPSAWASTTSTRGSGVRCGRWCRNWCHTPTTTPPPRTTTS